MIEVFHKALSKCGVKEIPGEVDNPDILEFFKVSGHSWVKNDELAWCSAFANWCARKAGFESTGKLNARSWLEVGTKVETPQLGDLVILWRKGRNSAYGHVGFYVNKVKGNILILGGNQGNQVRISEYNETRLLEYRRLGPIK